ncbi:hypothetical protein BTDUT50_11490 [Neobacillus thermocopriae]|nr:hypothetical protein BTDUT50_11490 [Neobacillus thermocopriae]
MFIKHPSFSEHFCLKLNKLTYFIYKKVLRQMRSYKIIKNVGKFVKLFHPISRRRLPLQRPKRVSGRGMRVPPFFCV